MYIQLILGEKCNLNCKYCHLWKYKNYLSIISNQIIDLLIEKIKNSLSQNEQLIIEFQGWEPFLYFHKMKDITLKIKQNFNNSQFILTTNWLLLNDQILSFLKRFKKSFSLNISFDWNLDITTINRTWIYNEDLTKKIIKNIQHLIKEWFNLTIIWTINKEWLFYNPKEIKYFLEKNFDNLAKDWQINYFFRPEIKLDKKETYNCPISDLILFHKKLSNLIDNSYYKNKYQLIEFNPELEKQTYCIDYDWTIYLNDYYKSYIKRIRTEFLTIFQHFFNIKNLYKLQNYHYFFDEVLKKDVNINTILNKYLDFFILEIEKSNKLFDYSKTIKYLVNDLKYIKNNKLYFIFNLNNETNKIYNNI